MDDYLRYLSRSSNPFIGRVFDELYFSLHGVFLASIHSVNAANEELKLKTPRGAEIELSVTLPSNLTKKAPAIVIAPGQGYHKDLPLTQGLAEKASENGFIVYRFNWNYFSSQPKGTPSEDLSKEVEDLQAVVDYAKSDKRVDLNKLVIAGKSLGTIVSYQVFVKSNLYAGLIFMTPICTDWETKKPVAEAYYPALARQTRPIVIALGNEDALCSVPMLYDFLKATKGNVSVNIFGGGHGLTFEQAGDPANAEKDARNLAAALTAIINWAWLIVGD